MHRDRYETVSTSERFDGVPDVFGNRNEQSTVKAIVPWGKGRLDMITGSRRIKTLPDDNPIISIAMSFYVFVS